MTTTERHTGNQTKGRRDMSKDQDVATLDDPSC